MSLVADDSSGLEKVRSILSVFQAWVGAMSRDDHLGPKSIPAQKRKGQIP